MSAPIGEDDLIALNAFVDGELDDNAVAEFEARLAADPALQAARDQILATRQAVRELPRPTVSADFLHRIEALGEPRAEAATTSQLRRRPWWEGWRNIAAAVLLTAFAASGATYFVVGPHAAAIEQLAAADHRRSLLAQTPVDVLSSDRHTVKPWLDARLGVSPPAPDLAAQGYPLLGGRVDVLGQITAPTLVYRHDEHTISVFALPGSTAAARPKALASGGYNMVEWSGVGFDFIAVSDLEPDELAAFVASYRSATGISG